MGQVQYCELIFTWYFYMHSIVQGNRRKQVTRYGSRHEQTQKNDGDDVELGLFPARFC